MICNSRCKCNPFKKCSFKTINNTLYCKKHQKFLDAKKSKETTKDNN